MARFVARVRNLEAILECWFFILWIQMEVCCRLLVVVVLEHWLQSKRKEGRVAREENKGNMGGVETDEVLNQHSGILVIQIDQF